MSRHPIDALWYTRCAVPTPFSFAAQFGYDPADIEAGYDHFASQLGTGDVEDAEAEAELPPPAVTVPATTAMVTTAAASSNPTPPRVKRGTKPAVKPTASPEKP